MSEPVRVPLGLDALIRTLVGGSGEDDRDQRASTFARGLALGALVGAAIAGSTIWQRRQARRPTSIQASAAADPDRPDRASVGVDSGPEAG